MRRWAETIAAGSLLTLAATPFAILFPEPPAFGQGAMGIVTIVAILAIIGVTYRSSQPRRTRILGLAALLLAITAATVTTRILLAGDISGKIPTLDILPTIFGLQGEDVDDAVLYEIWVELWLGCAVATGLATGLCRALRHRHLPRPAVLASPWDVMVPPAQTAPPWNAATILLWLIGCAVLTGSVLDGHRTAAFLSQSIHVTGTIDDPQPHPRIRFTTTDGTVVEFTQNGSVSRVLGASVPVAYLAADPPGSARADTFWANWSDVLGLLWIGLGFTLFPFFGLRATVRGGRW